MKRRYWLWIFSVVLLLSGIVGGLLGSNRAVAEVTAITIRVSVASDGTQGEYGSGMPSISADGRYVASTSWATNLVPSDSNGARHIFVHDRQTGQSERVSLSSSGEEGNARSQQRKGGSHE